MSVSKVCIRFWVFTRKKIAVFQVSVFKVSDLVSGFRSLRFACAFSSFACKRKAKTVTKCSFLC